MRPETALEAPREGELTVTALNQEETHRVGWTFFGTRGAGRWCLPQVIQLKFNDWMMRDVLLLMSRSGLTILKNSAGATVCDIEAITPHEEIRNDMERIHDRSGH